MTEEEKKQKITKLKTTENQSRFLPPGQKALILKEDRAEKNSGWRVYQEFLS